MTLHFTSALQINLTWRGFILSFISFALNVRLIILFCICSIVEQPSTHFVITTIIIKLSSFFFFRSKSSKCTKVNFLLRIGRGACLILSNEGGYPKKIFIQLFYNSIRRASCKVQAYTRCLKAPLSLTQGSKELNLFAALYGEILISISYNLI